MPAYGEMVNDSGIFVVFDPVRTFPVAELTSEALRNWYEERALVLWEEEPDRFQVRHRLEPIPEGVGRASLMVESGQIVMGCVGLLLAEAPDVSWHIPPGPYEVGVMADGPGQFTIYLERVDGFDGEPTSGELAPYWWDPHALAWIPPEPSESPVPLVTQLDLGSRLLEMVLRGVGRAVRATADHVPVPPLLVRRHSVERVDDGPDAPMPAAHHVVTAPDHRWSLARVRHPLHFPDKPTGDSVLHVWSLIARPLVVRVSRTGDRIHDAVFLTRDPQSENDRVECRRLVQAGYDAGRPLPVGRPRGPVAIAQEWTADRLLVRVGPVPRDAAPSIRVHFQGASGAILDVATPPPVRYRHGCWEYELWLVGPREGLVEAHVEVL